MNNGFQHIHFFYMIRFGKRANVNEEKPEDQTSPQKAESSAKNGTLMLSDKDIEVIRSIEVLD